MKRIRNWPRHLVREIEAANERPFVWGEHDCCMFAANCVKAITGEDLMPEFRGEYSDAESAKTALKEIGSRTLYNTVRSKLGNQKRPRPGDVVYYVFPTGPALGICAGQDCYFVGQEGDRQGLVTFPTIEMKRGFRVG